MGYSKINKGFRCLDLSTGKVYISRHVRFDELVFPFLGLMSSSTDSQAPQSTTPTVTLLPRLATCMTDLSAQMTATQ